MTKKSGKGIPWRSREHESALCGSGPARASATQFPFSRRPRQTFLFFLSFLLCHRQDHISRVSCSMRFKKSTVVGVMMTLCLSTGSWCMYISEKRIQTPTQQDETTKSPNQIQICGNELTNLIIEACDGILGSLNQGNSSKESAQAKITEDCCDHMCHWDYLQSYCGQTPLFSRKTFRGKFLSKLGNRTPSTKQSGSNTNAEKKSPAEVRIKKKRGPKKKGKKGGRKRKRSFKWKCAYKSFGHFLLNLDRNVHATTNMAKRPNNISRSWPPIQVGTISPEIDKFGGQPTVVVKKNKSNPI